MTTDHAVLDGLRAKARADFERRLADTSRALAGYLTSKPAGGPRFDVRELVREILGLDGAELHALLGRVAPGVGADGLEGLEAVRSFVGNYLLDDSVCKVVPEPDTEPLDDDPFFSTTLAFLAAERGATLESARAGALAAMRERERPLVVVPADETDVPATASDVLVALRHNRAIAEKRSAAFEEDWAPRVP